MTRKLASVQRIIDISPIEGADRIEVCRVLGWQCVIGKGQFKVGELVVFLEVDSVTPATETYSLLKDSGYRVKTRKFRKQISQGLCLSVHPTLADKCFPGCQEFGEAFLAEGTDLTEILQIQHYEVQIPAQLAGIVKGPFPEFLHKTDEERIQTCPQLLEKHQGKKFYVTEKVDGSSMTVYLNNGEFGVCSRNMDLKETEGNSYWKVARELKLEEKLKLLNRNICLQGELIGMGVQGNKYKLAGLEFRVFNVFDIDKQQHVGYNEFVRIVEQLGLKTVPLLNDSFVLPGTVDEMVEFSKGKSLLNKDTHREGIVLRPLVEEYEEDLRGRLSFKCINPDFLLKYSDD
jgi:RNA ligase (TIGR02306 family)